MAAHTSVGPEADSAQQPRQFWSPYPESDRRGGPDRYLHPSQHARWREPCPASDDGRHDVRVVGYLLGTRPDGLDCDSPLLVVCRGDGCDARTAWRCDGHRESRCKPCSARYRRRLTRLAAEGMHRRDGRGHMAMLTLTAPSPDEHQQYVPEWDRRTERPWCGCHRHLAGGLGLWNASSSQRWNRLRTALDREYPDMRFFRAVEIQDRGAVHLHLLWWTPVPVDLQRVQELALAAGFGCTMDYAPCEPGSRRAAYYVSKYVTKATDTRHTVPWDVLDLDTGELVAVPEARYRTWSSSRDWGITMKQLREAIRLHRARQARAQQEAASTDPTTPTPAPDAPALALSG